GWLRSTKARDWLIRSISRPLSKSWRTNDFLQSLPARFKTARPGADEETKPPSAPSTIASGPPREQGKAPRAHAPSTASAFLVEQGDGVRDARDEPTQAGEHQQLFDLP